jgi:hypothetical protein
MIKKYKQFINEALIHTYNITDNINSFKYQLDKLDIIYKLNIINKLNFHITIENMSLEDFIKVKDVIKLFGYFPSSIIENITQTTNNVQQIN